MPREEYARRGKPKSRTKAEAQSLGMPKTDVSRRRKQRQKAAESTGERRATEKYAGLFDDGDIGITKRGKSRGVNDSRERRMKDSEAQHRKNRKRSAEAAKAAKRRRKEDPEYTAANMGYGSAKEMNAAKKKNARDLAERDRKEAADMKRTGFKDVRKYRQAMRDIEETKRRKKKKKPKGSS